MTQSVDHVALLPAYLAAGTAVLVLLADLLVARRPVTVAVAGLGALAVAVVAVLVGPGRGPVDVLRGGRAARTWSPAARPWSRWSSRC